VVLNEAQGWIYLSLTWRI